MLTFGSLFAGIGGLDLGLERAGMKCVWQVEIDEFCRRVLEKHWPGMLRPWDVRNCDRRNLPWVDALVGGPPCQDLSSANTRGRLGLDGRQSGLWWEYLRIIGELLPRIVLVENVGQWKDWAPQVIDGLNEHGYATTRPLRLYAGSLGAPHRRARVFVVGYANSDRESARALDGQVARLSPAPRFSGYWRQPLPRVLGMVDGVPDRMERLVGVGNSVSPIQAEFVGRMIVEADGAMT